MFFSEFFDIVLFLICSDLFTKKDILRLFEQMIRFKDGVIRPHLMVIISINFTFFRKYLICLRIECLGPIWNYPKHDIFHITYFDGSLIWV